MDSWIWILLLAVAVIILIVVITATLRAIRPKSPDPLGATTGRVPSSAPSRVTTAMRGAAAPEGLDPDVIAQIDALVTAGQKIRAIKVLREATGSPLQDAKTRIDAWVPRAGLHATPAPAAFPPARRGAGTVAQLDPTVRAEIERLIAAGQKITAIKLLREATGLGLKESKDAVESWR